MSPQKRKIRQYFPRLLLLCLLAALLYFCAFIAAIHQTGTIDSAAPADVIIVLGAGLREDGRPGWALTRRSRQAAALWQAGHAPYVLCTGGQAEARPRAEAAACQETLLAAGLPKSAILLEARSRSTEENALYSKNILSERHLEQTILVSDSYHILRASWLFGRQGIEASASPVPAQRIRYPLFYPYSLVREFLAFHWYLLKEALDLPLTHLSGI